MKSKRTKPTPAAIDLPGLTDLFNRGEDLNVIVKTAFKGEPASDIPFFAVMHLMMQSDYATREVILTDPQQRCWRDRLSLR